MTNEEYWARRMELIMDEMMKKTDGVVDDIDSMYARVQAQLQKEIESFYARYADEKELDLATARQLLSNKESNAFRLQLA